MQTNICETVVWRNFLNFKQVFWQKHVSYNYFTRPQTYVFFKESEAVFLNFRMFLAMKKILSEENRKYWTLFHPQHFFCKIWLEIEQ